MGASKRADAGAGMRTRGPSKDKALAAAANVTSKVAEPQADEASEEQDRTRRSCLHKQLRKTKFCMYHLQGVCQFGESCAFAHSCDELQRMPNLRKTRLCKSFATGNCKDPECAFAHSEEELRSTDLFYKKSLCMWFEKGRCRNGSQCRFAHGVEEVNASMEAEATTTGRRWGTACRSSKVSNKGARNEGSMAGGGLTTGFTRRSLPNANIGATGFLEGRFGTGTNDRSSLEPMFVQTTPQLAAVHSGVEHLSQYKRQMENLQRASASIEAAVQSAQRSAQNGMWLQEAELLRRYEWQMEQLQHASVAAATAAAAAGGHFEGAQGIALQADLEKLTQNIAALSLQLSRFEMQMQERVTHQPIHSGFMVNAALAQALGLPDQSMLAGLGASPSSAYSYAALLGAPMPCTGGLYPGDLGLQQL